MSQNTIISLCFRGRALPGDRDDHIHQLNVDMCDERKLYFFFFHLAPFKIGMKEKEVNDE